MDGHYLITNLPANSASAKGDASSEAVLRTLFLTMTPPTFWIRTAAHFLLRAKRSTAVLSLMILAAVAVLIFLSALAVGINDAMIRNSVSLYSGHISGIGLPLTITKDQLHVAGVSAVLKRFHHYGLLLGDTGITTVTIVAVQPDEEKKHTALWKKTVDGSYLTPHTASLFVSATVAEHLAVGPQDTVTFKPDLAAAGTVFTVDGIYKTGVDLLDRNIVFCPVQSFLLQPATFSAAIFLNDGVNPDEVVEQYATLEPSGLQFKTWETLMPDLRELIDLNYVSMSIVIVLVFGVVALGISCAFVIFIIKNLREYGIMKAMGVTAGETAALIMAEVLLLSVAAALAGTVVGIVMVMLVRQTGIDLTAFTAHNRYFAISGVIFPRLTPFSLWVPPLLAIASSLVAGIWPAVVVIQTKAAAILRGA